MYFLSVCAIVKNEEPYLEEWLEFHLLQGVQHFFIYDNESTDNSKAIYDRYAKLGLLTLMYIQGTGAQFDAYNDALKRYRDRSKWIAFIDIDEFLFAPGKPLKDVLKHPELRKAAALAVHWHMFGSNNQPIKTHGLVIERFTKRAIEVNPHIKSIVRPKYAISVGNNPHTFRVRGLVKNERGENLPVEYALNEGGTGDMIRINHYHTKSKEEYWHRKSTTTDAGSGREYTPERIEEMFKAHDKNEIDDVSVLSFVQQIKNNIFARKR